MRWTVWYAAAIIGGMHNGPAPQFLRRVDPARNMARYYGLTLQPTLFGEMSLVRHWGRIGTRGRQKTESFASGDEAISALSKLATQKIRRGYASDDFGIAANTASAGDRSG